jgi:hypothetical protein
LNDVRSSRRTLRTTGPARALLAAPLLGCAFGAWGQSPGAPVAAPGTAATAAPAGTGAFGGIAAPSAAAAASAPAGPPPATHVVFAIDSRLVHTDNATPDLGIKQSDTVLEVQPSVVFERRGPRITLSGNAAVSGLTYLNDSQPARLLPRARIDLASKVIEDWAYFDAWYRIDPTFDDPYATRPEAATSYKLEPRRRYGLSPYLMHRFNELDSVLARVDYTHARITDFLTKQTRTTKGLDKLVTYERAPRSFGLQIEVKAHDESDDFTQGQTLSTREARLWLNWQPQPQLVLGIVGGREQTSLLADTPTDTLYGGRVTWRPNERSNLRVTVEHRYFGNGWDAVYAHNSATLTIGLQASRTVSSQGIPDNGVLPPGSASPVPVGGGINPAALYSVVAQLRESAGFQAALQGRRNRIYLQVGYLKQQALQMAGQTNIPDPSYDTEQKSASLGWDYKLGPLTTLTVIGDGSRIEGLGGANLGRYTTQYSLRIEGSRTLSPHTTATIGARRLTVKSNSTTLTSVDLEGEKAIYAGLRYRF